MFFLLFLVVCRFRVCCCWWYYSFLFCILLSLVKKLYWILPFSIFNFWFSHKKKRWWNNETKIIKYKCEYRNVIKFSHFLFVKIFMEIYVYTVWYCVRYHIIWISLSFSFFFVNKYLWKNYLTDKIDWFKLFSPMLENLLDCHFQHKRLLNCLMDHKDIYQFLIQCLEQTLILVNE